MAKNSDPLLYCWDVTLKEGELAVLDEENGIKSILKAYCKKWGFQLEKGEKGYRHYQIRFSLKEKKRRKWIVKRMFKGHVSPTSDKNKGNFAYVTKEHTRVAGPWLWTDQEEPWHIKQCCALLEWQRTVWESFHFRDDRKINILIDKKGGSGKSVLALKLLCGKRAFILPYVNCYKDVMRMAYTVPDWGGYIIDLPRAIDKTHLHGLFAGIEDLKRGFIWDDRYEFKWKLIGAPTIWVFTNESIDTSMLSDDRWNIYIMLNGKMVKMEE